MHTHISQGFMQEFARLLILWFSNLFHHNHDSKIIYYHDVSRKYTGMGTDLETIKRHFVMVKKCGYKLVNNITQQKGQVMVCFDDGWAGLYDVKDFFIESKVFPTVFIAVDLIGKPGYLTLQQILELQRDGFLFEGHTWSHKDLTTCDEEGLRHEIIDSKEELSRLLGKEVTAFCFPRGRFSNRVYQLSVEAGYKKLYSSITGGYFDLIKSKNLICRNLVQSVTDREFKYILNATSKFFVKRSIKQHYQQ